MQLRQAFIKFPVEINGKPTCFIYEKKNIKPRILLTQNLPQNPNLHGQGILQQSVFAELVLHIHQDFQQIGVLGTVNRGRTTFQSSQPTAMLGRTTKYYDPILTTTFQC